MFECPDVANFTREDILEEYYKLRERYQEICELNDSDKQKIHELKRSLDTATAAQTYLSQELEQYTNLDQKETENELHKNRMELVEMKKKYGDLQDSFVELQQNYSILLGENSKISKYVEKFVKCKEQHVDEGFTKKDQYMYHIESLENENAELLDKIQDLEECSMTDTRTIAECRKNIAVLRDQVKCLEENLQSKRIDLEEKSQIIESTQEQLAEANLKIATLSAVPNNDNRKGNSLFAEVDDQRQAMKQLLTAQKKSYIEMKKIYDESEHEIRRLKRENISMHTELEACSKIFCSADNIYQEKLRDRINNILHQNEYLEGKLKWTEERLKELGDDRGALFISSMLNYCRQETEFFKGQLYSARIQQARLEEQIRNSQQDVARWRFEALKSRCILIDREHLLTENKVAFKPISALEYNISTKDQEEAKPRIVRIRSNSDSDFEKPDDSQGPIEQKIFSPKETSEDVPSLTTTNNQQDHNEQQYAAANILPLPCENGNSVSIKPNIQNEDDSLHSQNEKNISSHVEAEILPQVEIKLDILDNIEVQDGIAKYKQNIDDAQDNASTTLDERPILNKFAKLKPNPPSPMRPSQRTLEKPNPKTSVLTARSILTNQNDLLSKGSSKNVKFSPDAVTIHNLSTDCSSPVGSTSGASSSNKKNTAKRPRRKSNVVVRRIVVGSKHV